MLCLLNLGRQAVMKLGQNILNKSFQIHRTIAVSTTVGFNYTTASRLTKLAEVTGPCSGIVAKCKLILVSLNLHSPFPTNILFPTYLKILYCTLNMKYSVSVVQLNVREVRGLRLNNGQESVKLLIYLSYIYIYVYLWLVELKTRIAMILFPVE